MAQMVAVLALVAAMAAVVSAQPAGPAAEQFVLSGVVAFDNGDGKAWLQEPRLTQDKAVVVRRGDSVGPWKVTKILPNRVELEGPGGTVIVPLQGSSRPALAAGGPAPEPAVGAAGEPKAPEGRTIHFPVGDPRRRENIKQFVDSLRPAGGEAANKQGSQALSKTGVPRQLPNLSAPPSSASRSAGKALSLPLRDPRRRESIKQPFAPR